MQKLWIIAVLVLCSQLPSKAQTNAVLTEQKAYLTYLALTFFDHEHKADFLDKEAVFLEGEALETLTKAVVAVDDKMGVPYAEDGVEAMIIYNSNYCTDCSTLVESADFNALLEKYTLEVKTNNRQQKIVTVRSDKMVNYYAFQQEILALNPNLYLQVVTQTDIDGGIIGASSGTNIYYNPESQEITFSTWHGWGDCPSGCIYQDTYYWHYNIKTGAVQEIASIPDDNFLHEEFLPEFEQKRDRD